MVELRVDGGDGDGDGGGDVSERSGGGLKPGVQRRHVTSRAAHREADFPRTGKERTTGDRVYDTYLAKKGGESVRVR